MLKLNSGKLIFVLVACVCLIYSDKELLAQPKREMRAVWIATVSNIDWPLSRFDSVTKQKNDLINLLTNLKSAGINCVIFQVRPECDAFYDSSIEPWSYWLTGQQGKIPSPYYDPLEFAITEAHKRGMELHAWFNPYRAEVSVGAHPLSPNHVVNQNPEWILYFEKINQNLLDPGLQEVRDYVTGVIQDVVARYDIDGIHFDDYFYPYPNNGIGFPGITTEDALTFASYPRGFTDIGDWRRDNVNLLVKQVYEGIKAIKSRVKFGISPFGIWKNDVPAGIVGLDAYNQIYADALSWISAKTIDYLTPQIYWPFDGPQDYGKLLPWWAAQMNDRHLYPGHAAYKLSQWQPDEMPRQIRLNRETDNVYGSVYFSAKRVLANTNGFMDSLKTDLYRYPALQPAMNWLDSIPPNEPQDLIATNEYKGTRVSWSQPYPAADGDTAAGYVLYRLTTDDSLDLEDPAQILAILPDAAQEFVDDSGEENRTYAYYVTTLDRLQNESFPSNRVEFIFTGLYRTAGIIPLSDQLEQNYPNPFNPFTTIEFFISEPGYISLDVYDTLGRRISRLIDGNLSTGSHSVRFDGSAVPSGVYFYHLTSERQSFTRKMMLIK